MLVPPKHPKRSFLVGKPMVVGYDHFRKPPYDKGMVLEKIGKSEVYHPPIEALGYLPCSGVHGGSPGNCRQNRVPKTGFVTTTQYWLKKISNHLLKKKLKHYIKPYKAARVWDLNEFTHLKKKELDQHESSRPRHDPALEWWIGKFPAVKMNHSLRFNDPRNFKRCCAVFVARRMLNYYCNVHSSLETGVWKNKWKNNGCNKLGNGEILQDRKKHEKKILPTMAPTQWLPHAIPIPILYHCSSWTSSKDMMDPPRPGPSCGARRPTVEYTRKKGKTQATKWTFHDLPVWIDRWLQSISPRFLVVSVNMAAPNDFLSMAVSISPWLTHPSPHGSCAWSVTRSGGSHDRFGWSVWGVAAAVLPVPLSVCF